MPSRAASGQPDDYERAIAKNDLRQALALAEADQRDEIQRQFRVGYVKLLLDDIPAAKDSFQSCYNAAGLPETTTLCAAGLSVASVVQQLQGNRNNGTRLAQDVLQNAAKSSSDLAIALASLAVGLDYLSKRDAKQADTALARTTSSSLFADRSPQPQLASMIAQVKIKIAEQYHLDKNQAAAIEAYNTSFNFLTRTLDDADPNLLLRLLEIAVGVSFYVQNPLLLKVSGKVLNIATASSDTRSSGAAMHDVTEYLRVSGYSDEAIKILWVWQDHLEKTIGQNSLEAAKNLIDIGWFETENGKSDEGEQFFEKGLTIIEQKFGKESKEYRDASSYVDIKRKYLAGNKAIVENSKRQANELIDQIKKIETCALNPNAPECSKPSLNRAAVTAQVEQAIASAQKLGGDKGLKYLLEQITAIKKIKDNTKPSETGAPDESFWHDKDAQLIDAGLKIAADAKSFNHWTYGAFVAKRASLLARDGNYALALSTISDAINTVKTAGYKDPAPTVEILKLYTLAFFIIPSNAKTADLTAISIASQRAFREMKQIAETPSSSTSLAINGVSAFLDYGAFFEDRKNAAMAAEAFAAAKRFANLHREEVNDYERERIDAGVARSKQRMSSEAAAAQARWTAISRMDKDDPTKPDALKEAAQDAFEKPNQTADALKFIREAYRLQKLFLKERKAKLPLSNSDELRWRIKYLDDGIFIHLRLLARSQKGQSKPSESELSEAYELMQLRLVGTAADASLRAAARIAVGPALSPTAEKLDKSTLAWRNARNALSKLASGQNTKGENGHLIETLADNQAQAIEAAQLLTKKSPTYASISSLEGISISQTKQVLSDREAILLLAFNKDDGLIGMLVSKKATKLVDLGSAIKGSDAAYERYFANGERIERLIAALRNSILQGTKFDYQSARELNDILIKPFDRELLDVDRIVVAPDLQLLTLPFAALVLEPSASASSGNTTSWLISRFAITLALSPKSFFTLRASTSQPAFSTPFAGFANPVIDATGCPPTTAWGRQPDPSVTCALRPVPQTITQVSDLAKALGADLNRSTWTGQNFTADQVTKSLSRPVRVVAFATHGILSNELYSKARINEPALLASPGIGEPIESRWLTASQIEAMSINSDLLILSACNTGAGLSSVGQEQGEAFSGLIRAFFEAGVRGTLVTNWEIEVNRTTELITAMAHAMAKEPQKRFSDVLRESMLAQSRTAANPRDWAMFSYVGQ